METLVEVLGHCKVEHDHLSCLDACEILGRRPIRLVKSCSHRNDSIFQIPFFVVLRALRGKIGFHVINREPTYH